jgi:hypothetical protein
MSQKAQSTLEKLRLAIHGVTAPISCEGTFVPDKPLTFILKDKTRFEVIRAKTAFEQKNALTPLLNQCKPAPFGDGKKTRYDRRVRDALQLRAEGKGLSIEHFDPEAAGTWQSRAARDPELPAAALLHSCDYCPWGYFGNESSEVDLYTYAAFHIEIPTFDKGPRAASRLSTPTMVKRARSIRKGSAKQE